jgi:translation initiation factor 5B
MAPKKKGKQNDDWEADLGETIEPAAATPADEEASEEGAGGGLLATLKKNKSNKKKKGKHVEEDYLDGEDPPIENGVNGHAEPDGIADLASKAPEEATTDDLFAEQATKTKGGKGKSGKGPGILAPNEDGEGDGEDGGGLKSKKEKEKEKREREKQRKKEQVGPSSQVLSTMT